MEILIGEHKKMYKDSPGVVARVIKYIDSYLKEHNVIIDKVMVNDEIVSGDFETYLRDNKDQIFSVKTTVKTPQQVVEDMITEAFQYIDRTLPMLQGVAEQFVVHPNDATWSSFTHMMEGVDWLCKMAENSERYSQTIYMVLASAMKSLNEWLKEMEVALANKDFGLVGDLIQYELVEIYQQIYDAIDSQILTKKV